MLFLGIISCKGASRFNRAREEAGGGGEGAASFLSRTEGSPWRGISFEGGFSKKSWDAVRT